MEVHGEVNLLHGALDRGTADLPVSLCRVTVSDRKKGSFYRDRQIERASRDEFFAVEISAMPPRWEGEM